VKKEAARGQPTGWGGGSGETDREGAGDLQNPQIGFSKEQKKEMASNGRRVVTSYVFWGG